MKRREFLQLAFLGLVGLKSTLVSAATLPLLNRPVNELADNPNYFGFLALGDMGTGWKQEYKIAQEMAKRPSAEYPAIILLGDLLYPSAKADLIEPNLHKPFQPLIQNGFRFYPLWGNHDWLEAKAAHLKNYFVAPDYYTFKMGPAQFWNLNSNQFDAVQLNWLKNSLKTSRSKWKIVSLHHSPYCSGLVHGNNSMLIQQLSPVMEQNKVDLCMSGHNHLYERTEKINGIVYIVSGGGSASLHKYKDTPSFPRALIKSEYHFLQAKGDATSLFIQAINAEGQEIDHILLSK